ncbi:ImmA/IrrE family metallo-endopeptidase [Shouchella rhizosphaerae]|uniref:ImmA/IrrE family metallo-endopeptidase n=1 Tax=Shouchella rhizosphaerae TaxID=866786 RepID=UPI003F7F9AD8
MNIPSKIKVGGVEYTVEELTDDPESIGLCLYDSLIIKVDPRLKMQKKQQVFIHELLHACFHEAGYIEQDEDMINRLGKVLYQVLMDNKQVLFGDGFE